MNWTSFTERFPGSAVPMPWWEWASVAGLLHLLCFTLVLLHCLRHRREAPATLLWIFVAWGFPFVGPLIYLALGIDRVPQKIFRKRSKDQALWTELKARNAETLPLAYWRAVHESAAEIPHGQPGYRFNRAVNSILAHHPLLDGNRIRPLVTGDEAYPKMMEAIRSAGHHIHLQCFIISNDDTGRAFLDLLAEKAREGVTVRLLYDRFGCTKAVFSGLFRKYRRIPNLHIAGWTLANPLKRQFQINLRNHRKSLIVDGRLAFTGGINISLDNVARDMQPAIRDYHFEVVGPIVQELQYTFLRDWYFITDEDPDNFLQEVYFPQLPAIGAAKVRQVDSGPSHVSEILTDVYFAAIVSARNELMIVTPYFIPNRDLVRALRAAALRGVNVRLVVPRKNNHRYAGLAGQALYEELLEAGVRIFERRPPFLHAKALIVDDAAALVGTANFDARSFRLNFESTMVVLDEAFCNQLKPVVLADLAESDEVILEEWQKRPNRRKMLENLAFLMMPGL
ncbi:MAG: cardiolipin synthase [Kiritimatiellia bacterium]